MTSEAQVQQELRVLAPHHGSRLWRNNSGVLPDRTGRPVRYGLANESKELNKVLKSSDLIGLTPVLIEQRHVGRIAGLFTGIEVKDPTWLMPENEREEAQQRFLELVASMGGIATFATDAVHFTQAIERWRA